MDDGILKTIEYFRQEIKNEKVKKKMDKMDLGYE